MSRTQPHLKIIALVWCMLGASCAFRSGWAWHEVEVWVATPEQSSVTVATDRFVWQVDHVEITLASLELVPCEQEEGVGYGMLTRLMTRLTTSGEAFAHLLDASLKLPLRQPLLGKRGQTVLLGQTEPPAGTYCAMRVGVGPGDDASSSLRVEGSWSEQGAMDGESTPFVFESRIKAQRVLRLREPLVFERGEDKRVIYELLWRPGAIAAGFEFLDPINQPQADLARGWLTTWSLVAPRGFVTEASW